MSRIIFFNIPAHGHTNPTLNVVRELVSRGHEVLYYSYDLFKEKIEATGATFVSCDSYDTQLQLSPKQAARMGKDLSLSTKVLVDTTLALGDAITQELIQLRPDCIVADSMALWGKAIARKLDIPFVSSTTTFAFNQHSAGLLKQSLGDFLRMILSMPQINRQLKRLQDHGYPFRSVLDILQNDDNTHTIVYTSPEFQPFSDTFSDKFSFVGPSIRPPVSTIKKIRPKLIYVSMGTVDNQMLPLYRRCIKAFADLDHQVILSIGTRVPPEAFGPLPDHISLFSYVDQIAVLQQADVFLTHCGMNSVSEGLYFGVPLVMLPQTPEQWAVARRVQQIHAGILLKKTDPKSIRAAVELLLSQTEYRESATQISASFHAAPGAAGAADKILSVCTRNG
ncbi:MAG: glucosyltransferase [Oscillospiraceae bacterium]|nr:glucosyltransferase [Oscillospiraceae bacterium]